jgi:hypothetical protein
VTLCSGSNGVSGTQLGAKVCWQVTGVRQNAWARQYPLKVERTKRSEDRGKYLSPYAFGMPRQAGIHYVPVPKQRRLRRPKVAA